MSGRESRRRGTSMPADARVASRPGGGAAPAPPGRVSVLALDGIPEIVPGDDLAATLVTAIRATPGALPLRQDDVLVVTQKVVSKAEDATVDLASVTPRPEAVAFAERWDRDARQVEVVLREARRVVRMESGVLITTPPPPRSGPRSPRLSESTSRSSSPTASAGRGAGESWTWPSG